MSRDDAKRPRQFADVLVERGLVTREQVEEARAQQGRLGKSFTRVLVDLKMVSEPVLVALLAQEIGLEFVDLGEYPIDPSAAALVPESLARRHCALPIAYDGVALLVAMSDPQNVFARDDIRTLTGLEVKPVIATRSDILSAIGRFNRMDTSVENIAAAAAAEESEAEDLARVQELVEDAPIVKLVNLLITQAVNDRASDIHVEPQERDVRVRYRVDGVLHEVMRSPKSIQSGVISRLKIMSDINIAERRIPQDGRVGLVVGGRAIDLRVATLPTVYGEKVVIRILDKSSVLLKLQDLGFSAGNFQRFETAYRKPYGMILVTGPTGSGKSTTLYATLNILNLPDRNIITVEDPVEYRLGGVNQIQINTRAGLTFASALRSILRSDPDIVLIGEIRDRETAQIAVEAALTGHLVLSTLHTNDAPSAVTRLTEMGIETFLVGSALDCVLAQRLIRRLCDRCREPHQPTPDAAREAGIPLGPGGEVPTIYRAVGCQHCGKTGYHGRMSVHEVMLMSEEIERLTVERRPSEEIGRTARQQGMRGLREDGIEKVLAGDTSIEEIMRVIV
ncbi:MAG: Flp pilus assembly complex ATPase component TadA [Acidobacteria bacterium]|nr:Flp pilus assembly complex ATPase component TadA [Acidobacteriota bacterium]